jgi:dienelactone hydrolase
LPLITFFPEGAEYEDPCYWANHHFSMLVACGCTLGDAEFASAPAMAVAKAGRASTGTGKFEVSQEYQTAFAEGYLAAADRLEAQADADLADGRKISAGEKLLRASIICELLDWNYWPFGTAEGGKPGQYHRKGRAAFKKGLALAGGVHAGTEWLTVPFEGRELEALFVPARERNGDISEDAAPAVLHLNGMHSSLQWQYSFGLSAALAARGIASFHFDHPGSGKARYDQGLPARPDSESYGSAAIDVLVTRGDVDPTRIGLLGGSFGSYRAPRIAAFDDRVKTVVAWSTQYDLSADFPEVMPRLLGSGQFDTDDDAVLSVIRAWTGIHEIESLRQLVRSWTLAHIMPNVKASLLCVMGDLDMMPPTMAQKMLDEATNSPHKKLIVTNAKTGGREHCHWDEPSYARAQMVDFLAEELGGRL